MKPRFRKPISQRDVRNTLQGLSALHLGTTPEFEPVRASKAKGKKQPESKVVSAVKDWAAVRPDVTLFRNQVGAYQWAPGMWIRYGLAKGSSDLIGWRTVTVTPGMVGQRIAQFFAVECKTDEGVLSPEQQEFIERVRDAGGAAGVARSAQDSEDILRRWMEGML